MASSLPQPVREKTRLYYIAFCTVYTFTAHSILSQVKSAKKKLSDVMQLFSVDATMMFL